MVYYPRGTWKAGGGLVTNPGQNKPGVGSNNKNKSRASKSRTTPAGSVSGDVAHNPSLASMTDAGSSSRYSVLAQKAADFNAQQNRAIPIVQINAPKDTNTRPVAIVPYDTRRGTASILTDTDKTMLQLSPRKLIEPDVKATAGTSTEGGMFIRSAAKSAPASAALGFGAALIAPVAPAATAVAGTIGGILYGADVIRRGKSGELSTSEGRGRLTGEIGGAIAGGTAGRAAVNYYGYKQTQGIVASRAGTQIQRADFRYIKTYDAPRVYAREIKGLSGAEVTTTKGGYTAQVNLNYGKTEKINPTNVADYVLFRGTRSTTTQIKQSSIKNLLSAPKTTALESQTPTTPAKPGFFTINEKLNYIVKSVQVSNIFNRLPSYIKGFKTGIKDTGSNLIFSKSNIGTNKPRGMAEIAKLIKIKFTAEGYNLPGNNNAGGIGAKTKPSSKTAPTTPGQLNNILRIDYTGKIPYNRKLLGDRAYVYDARNPYPTPAATAIKSAIKDLSPASFSFKTVNVPYTDSLGRQFYKRQIVITQTTAKTKSKPSATSSTATSQKSKYSQLQTTSSNPIGSGSGNKAKTKTGGAQTQSKSSAASSKTSRILVLGRLGRKSGQKKKSDIGSKPDQIRKPITTPIVTPTEKYNPIEEPITDKRERTRRRTIYIGKGPIEPIIEIIPGPIIRDPPPPPPPPPPPDLFKFRPLLLGGGLPSRSSWLLGSRRKTSYQSDLTSSLFNVRRAVAPRVLTGLEIRPIVKRGLYGRLRI